MRTLVPDALRPANWKCLDKVEWEDILAMLVGLFLDISEEKDFLEAQLKLSKAYKHVLNEMDIRQVVDEVLMYETVKTQIRKIKMNDFTSEKELERKLARLVDISLTTKETIDIFAVAGIEKTGHFYSRRVLYD
ncbi:type I restriction enzyme endonuclease domain-containing protein [Robertmurraya sp.]|uniref:type I restriction enzyme endonuclease domain-containing protein n=1 Tax=Robertmurraya sp. TaxID=2837525 RepID=UPI003703EAFC